MNGITRRPLRVLLGTDEIAGHLYDLAAGFRAIGHETTTVVQRLNPFYEDLSYDVIAELHMPRAISETNSFPVRALRKGLKASHSLWTKGRFVPPFRGFDLYVFQFGSSLMAGNRDYPLIKRAGKKLVSIFVGSDIRHWSAAFPARAALGLGSYEGFRDSWLSLDDNLRALRMAERYADVILSQPSYGELAVRPYNHLYLAVDLSRYDFHVPARDVPVIVHAPSLRAYKGTEEILKCVEELKAEGLDFDFRIVENCPNRVVLEAIRDADVVVDEINEAHYGKLALESMASGCAVAGGNRGDVVPFPKDPPTLHLSPKTLKTQLTRLITDKTLRLDLANRGRRFVEEHYSHSDVAARIVELAYRESKAPLDYYPTFFAREYRLPDGEHVSKRMRKLTSDVVTLHGLPTDVDAEDFVARGLMDHLKVDPRSIPRWEGSPKTS